MSEALSRLQKPPKLLIAASAIGYYGSRPGEVLDERSAPGQGFLAKVCQDWEAATLPAQRGGIRVVNARFGIILSAAGGALKKMLLPFQMGVGGRLGSGQQDMSWIALDDVVAALYHVIHTPNLSGPVNFVSCLPVNNSQFTKALGHVLKRPTIFPMPEFVVKTLFGEMGQELLLTSQRVLPQKLQDSGYNYHFPDLKEALRHLLGK